MRTAPKDVSGNGGGAGGRGFTLVELLIVIGIIALLMVIGLAVGRQVVGQGKQSLTESTLKAMDGVLNEYMSAKDSVPPAWVLNPEDENQAFPVADARVGTGPETINSVALFIVQAEEVPNAKASLQGLDPRQIREYQPLNGTMPSGDQPLLRTVFDGWGNPIRYVHPKFQGIITGSDGNLSNLIGNAPTGASWVFSQIRRDTDEQDADGGLCVGGRPYFYSAGPDGDPSTVADNVYSTQPQFSK